MVKRGEAQAFIKTALAHKGDACLDWPFATNRKGYGIVRWGGRSTIASKVVCALAHGMPDGREAAHSCGNSRCCNPAHLRAATSAENKADMIAHGTAQRGERHPLAKLSQSQVREIRRARGNQSELARKFGVTPKTVSLVVRRVTWAHV